MRIPVVALLSLSLTGCALNNTASPTAETGLSLQGKVHGGQQPIVGAHVYLLAANTTGYGGNGIAASTSNASVSLLTSSTGHVDTIGNYVLTGSDGSFTITGDYTCTAGQQVYLYALGGNPGAGTNSAAGLMAILGNCPGTTFPASTYVWINEVSTVAAAYAFAGFATDATHVSSSATALAKTGIANAFANATNLASLSTGAALATTPAGNGTVPQATINTLANILTACVNSTGPTSGTCSTLFTNAKSAGTTGTTATDTATAAINIAHNPANVTALYAIPTPAVAFAPVLTAQPNDLTIAIIFSGGGLNAGGQGSSGGVAVDGSGNIWITRSSETGVIEFSPLGAPLSGTLGYSGPVGSLIAIDGYGDAWTTDYTTNTVTEYSSSGVIMSGTNGYAAGTSPFGIAIAGTGYVWVADEGTANAGVVELNPYSGNTLYSYNGSALHDPTVVALDTAGNAWVANGQNILKINTGGVVSYSAAGAYGVAIDSLSNVWTSLNPAVLFGAAQGLAKLGSNGVTIGVYTGGGLDDPSLISIDGNGSVWVSNGGSCGCISEFSNSGVPLSPGTGFVASGLNGAQTSAVDGSGNVWIGNTFGFGIYEFVGVASPVVTPLATALASNTLGTRP